MTTTAANISKSHEADYRYMVRTTEGFDASDLFAIYVDVLDTYDRQARRWGATHKRPIKTRDSWLALIRRESLKWDAENDMGMRRGGVVAA